MKRVLFSAAVTMVALFSTHRASATFVDGDFSSKITTGGYYIDCSDSKNYCGFAGWSSAYGRYYFMAADGSNWWLTSATYDPSEDLQNGSQVFAQPAREEDFPGDDTGNN